MTHTAAQRNHFTELQQQVCDLLGWSYETCCAYIEKCGKQYLQHYIPQDPQGIDMLVESKAFWSWGRTNWYYRDAQYLQCMIGGSKEALVDCYKELHDPRTLAAQIYPNGVVLNATYAVMIQELIDAKREIV
jgi:hypothetical protein